MSELENVLQKSSLHALLILTSRALTRAGFGDVQILDRRTSGEKSRFGGHELLCEGAMGHLPSRVVVKVINDGVRVRMLDELAGVVARTRADLGLIVSPRHITKKALKHLGTYGSLRLDVIDGPALAALLRQYQIGVKSRGEVDHVFFNALEEASDRLLTFIKFAGYAG